MTPRFDAAVFEAHCARVDAERELAIKNNLFNVEHVRGNFLRVAQLAKAST